MTETQRLRIQIACLLFTAAFLALIAWNTDSYRNRWIAGPSAAFFVVAGLWKVRQFQQRDTLNARAVR